MGSSNILLYLFVFVLFFAFAIIQSQTRFRDKMLCTFRRPNKVKIEKWVPMSYAGKYVTFDRGRYGIGQYYVNPKMISLQWYDRGINKLFPILVPTLDFRYNNDQPIDPETGLNSWLTPEAQYATYQEHQHIAYAKGTAAQVGKKEKIPAFYLGAVAIVLVIALGFYVYQSNNAFAIDLANITNLLKLGK